MADEMFPIQDGPSVPWAYMAPHEAQARKNHGQTLEGLAKRGGLGCAEAWVIVHGLKHRDILHEEHKDKWIELAERVNREWSVKQARTEVLAAYRDHLSHVQSLVLEAEIKTGDKDTILSALDYEPEPAASDLEALLRKEREKYLEVLCASVCSFCADGEKFDLHGDKQGYWCHTEKGVSPTWKNQRCVAMSFRNVSQTLERARASEGKG